MLKQEMSRELHVAPVNNKNTNNNWPRRSPIFSIRSLIIHQTINASQQSMHFDDAIYVNLTIVMIDGKTNQHSYLCHYNTACKHTFLTLLGNFTYL